MGIINSIEIDNALYGFKGDIIDGLRNGEVPRWFHPRTGGGDETAEEILATQVERAKGQKFGGIASFRIYGTDPSKRPNVYSPTDKRTRPPERIRQRLEDYLNSQTHEQEQRYLRPGEFYDGLVAEVRIGKRGGIQDVCVEALYRD